MLCVRSHDHNRVIPAVMLWLILSTMVLVVAPAWSQDQATSFPANIEVVGAVREPSDPLGVTVAGKHAYLCAADDGLHIVEFSDPKKPVKVGTCATLERATDVAVRDQYVYVANGNLGFRVVDVWESEEAFKKFGETLVPLLQALGIQVQPEVYPAIAFVR